MIIDDDVKEITSCRGLCQTVHVSGGQGLGLSEWRQLQSLVGMASPFAAHGRQDPTFGGSMRAPVANGQIPGAFPRTNSQMVPGMSCVPPSFATHPAYPAGYQQNVHGHHGCNLKIGVVCVCVFVVRFWTACGHTSPVCGSDVPVP